MQVTYQEEVVPRVGPGSHTFSREVVRGPPRETRLQCVRNRELSQAARKQRPIVGSRNLNQSKISKVGHPTFDLGVPVSKEPHGQSAIPHSSGSLR